VHHAEIAHVFDVAVRAALGTGADVRVLDPVDQARPSLIDRGPDLEAPAPPGPAEGRGALLRFAVGA